MAWQKGLDLLAEAVPALVALGGQLAVLGIGDPELEQRFQALGLPIVDTSDASLAMTKIWLT